MTLERDLWTFTMRWFWLTILFVLALAIMTAAAWAETVIPTEEQKIDALKLGYILNNNSMKRELSEGSMDMSGMLIDYKPPPHVVQTVPEMPVADPANKNKLDEQADLNMKSPVEPRHRRGRGR